MHKKKCLELKDHVHAALSAAAGRPVTLDIRVQESRTSSNSASGNTSPTSRPANVPIANNDADDLSLADDDNQPVESVVDQIAKQFPGARIVDTSQN